MRLAVLYEPVCKFGGERGSAGKMAFTFGRELIMGTGDVFFAPRPATQPQCASESKHRRHFSLPLFFPEWSLPIQTFTNGDQLIFPYGFGELLQPLALIIHRPRIRELSPPQTRPQPFSRCARQAGTNRIL